MENINRRKWEDTFRPAPKFAAAVEMVYHDGYSVLDVLRMDAEIGDDLVDLWIAEADGHDFDLDLANAMLMKNYPTTLSVQSYAVATALINTYHALTRLANWNAELFRVENRNVAVLLKLFRISEQFLVVWDEFDMGEALRLYLSGVPVEAVEGSLRGGVDSGLVLRAYGVESA